MLLIHDGVCSITLIPSNKDWKNESDEWNRHQIQAQIDRTQFSTNWCLPRLYYTVRFVFINKIEDEMNNIKQSIAFTVRLIAWDTTSFLRRQSQSFHYDHYQYLKQQYQWLQEVLRDNEDDDWIIVFGHHPLQSVPKPDADSVDRKLSRNQREHRFTFSQLTEQAVWKHEKRNYANGISLFFCTFAHMYSYHDRTCGGRCDFIVGTGCWRAIYVSEISYCVIGK